MKESIFKQILKIEKELNSQYSDYPNVSLLSGTSGLPIFYFMLYNLTKNEAYKVKSNVIVENIFSRINNDNINVSYCTGLAGIGYMLHFLQNNGFLIEDINEELNIIDEI